MQIRMQNAEVLTRKQLNECVKGSEGIEFQGQDRAKLYGWVQRVLVAQEAGRDSRSRECRSAQRLAAEDTRPGDPVLGWPAHVSRDIFSAGCLLEPFAIAQTGMAAASSRLYSALAASYFESGGNETERRELEWLERQGPPVRAGSAGKPVRAVAFGPTNYPGHGPPVLRGQQPRVFAAQGPSEAKIYFMWSVAGQGSVTHSHVPHR